MIALISGKVEEVGRDTLIILVNGVGVEVIVSEKIIRNVKKYEEVCFHTFFSLKQDSVQIFGFLEKEERELFKILQNVDKVGPKTAFNMISSLGVKGLKDAISNNNSAALATVPGIGQRTAARLLVELKGKIGAELFSGITEAIEEVELAVKALIKLGYTRNEAQEAIRGVSLNSDKTIENLIKEALLRLSKTRGELDE